MTVADAVFDASVFLRSAMAGDAGAGRWLAAAELGEIRAHAPDLVYVEAANGLRNYVRARLASRADASDALASIVSFPLRVEPIVALVEPALAIALEHGLSAYDATYLALAEATGATLVTADRVLADAATDAVLLV